MPKASRYSLSPPGTMFAPRQTLAASRNGRTQDISNRGVYFIVADGSKPDVDHNLAIRLPVEQTPEKNCRSIFQEK